LRGFYVYVTQDGVTHARWFREQHRAEDYWRRLYREHEVEAHIRGEGVVDPAGAGAR
jgi:hypothetical protein